MSLPNDSIVIPVKQHYNSIMFYRWFRSGCCPFALELYDRFAVVSVVALKQPHLMFIMALLFVFPFVLACQILFGVCADAVMFV